jgi:hypothetical protein
MLSPIDQKPRDKYLTSGRPLATQFSSPRDGDNEMKPSQQRFVDPGATADGDDGETGKFLASLQEMIDFKVCVTIMAVFHISAFAKKRIRFIEKQDGTTLFGRTEDTAEILFCLANVFRDHCIQIDPV